MCSVLPRETLQAMWTQWFYNDPQFYPEQASFLRHTRDFSRHDVLFRFKDCSETVVTLRCSAQEFLSSPWLPEDGYPGTFACFAEPNRNTANGPNGPYILGAVSIIPCYLDDTEALTVGALRVLPRTSSGPALSG